MTTATAVAGVLLFRVADPWVPLAAGARRALAAMRSAARSRAERPSVAPPSRSVGA